ncbi:hypothetical protein BEN71_12640 [Acinetobacter wuhouensis]|uniref:DUF7710 domain-containing protein n=1 Tax=Acinetobacter wuhouensis TaxID=1879050 RepID=UPI00083AD81E|nr:hypothetical protein [Acinetobacter wuhouensis]AXQ22868.1 hypothetical protein BEN71_12640 [Acinetobacter wuhouensis]
MSDKYIWIIQSSENLNIIGCFINKNDAEQYILENKLKCMLTRYPVDITIYDWVIKNELWLPKNDLQKNSKFRARFSSAYLEHHHFFQEES